jgi:hypothetical protein
LSTLKPFDFYVSDSGCFICTSHARNIHGGHSVFQMNGKKLFIHRYIYEQCFGEIPNGVIIRHTCDTPECINPEHLITGSHKDNALDRVQRNRSAIGTQNGRSKLTEDQAMFIKHSDLSSWKLAQQFKVDPKTIRDIMAGNTWSYLA